MSARPAKAIVTGGAGFIGSHVLDRLLERGVEVAAVDNLSTGRRENLAGALARGARLHEDDACDAGAMRALLEAERPAMVFHLAAQVSVIRSVAEPERDADVNVGGTLAVLEAARRAGVGRFVYVSTGGALYGEADVVPTPEDAPIRPLSPYGASKWAGEAYCDLYSRLHGMSTVTLRLANVYGPRQDPFGEAGVIAIFCARLRAGARPTVFGDGRQTRDYVYVGDAAAATVAAGEAAVGGALNIGCGTETSVLELVDTLRELGEGGGKTAAAAASGGGRAGAFEPEHAPPRAGEARRSCLDPARAARELGWRAQTPLREGLRATLASVGG
jgi:UDP-glucose 4-epimerase